MEIYKPRIWWYYIAIDEILQKSKDRNTKFSYVEDR